MKIGEIAHRILFRLNGRVLHFKPKGKSRGNVLMSYVTLPYLNPDPKILDMHTNRWESMEMVRAFVERRYAVDLIDTSNTSFIPKKKYDIFVDNGSNMDRLTPLLGPDCKKILHATTAHWKFNNDAEQKRFDELFERRGVRLPVDRVLKPNKAAEFSDEITLLGNEFTSGTYSFANKKISRIPISTTHLFNSPKEKDFEAVRKNFIWFGGAGVIHKGLDLVVEAFAQMPEYNLTICGKIDGEKDFLEIYKKELALPNMQIAGFVDPGSEAFERMRKNNVALIYPSCSEGQSGAVVLCMHAGLIPITSYESGVDVGDSGVILKENTIEQIKTEVTNLASSPSEILEAKARSAWEFARANHTRETLAKSYRAFVDGLLADTSIS